MLPENRDPINFIDFQVTADGKRVEPQVEVKAIRHGVDVTEVLSGMEFRSHCSESDAATFALREKACAITEGYSSSEKEREGVGGPSRELRPSKKKRGAEPAPLLVRSCRLKASRWRSAARAA